MATAAITNNLNELDVLLKDLSAARYSGHVEHLETVIESRSYSSSSVAPIPPERSFKSGLRGQFSVDSSDLHDVHITERGRSEDVRDFMDPVEDGYEESPPPIRKWSAEKGSIHKTFHIIGQRTEEKPSSFSTSELDDLQTTLRDFEIDGNIDEPVIGEAPYVLSEDLQETLRKEECKARQEITVMGRTWLLDLFCCNQCNQELQPHNFFERDGVPYCEKCYNLLYGQRQVICAVCRKPIKGRCITAMFRKFHPECFVCSYCQQPLKNRSFKEEGDKPYCQMCFDRLFG